MSAALADYASAGASLLSHVWRLAPGNPPRYVYKPLDEGRFRLLHLLAGAADDSVIRVRLVDEAVDAAPEYHAVSYVWGNAWQTVGILCEGAEIRTRQIMLMEKIYSRAASVLVWLGKDDAGLEGIEALIDAALKVIPEAVDDPVRNRESAATLAASIEATADIRDLSPERLSALWKAMTGERAHMSDRVDVDWSEQFKAFFTGFDTWLTSEDPEEAERARLSFVTSGMAIEQSIVGFGIGRRLFPTAEGRLCMAPVEARAGDVVCVLLGCEVPLVIRPTGQGMYELIGEAYVSGIMDGEALSGEYDQMEIMLE
ncbi:hypothetical protein PpBr36_08855 [Pyricularia pennisetigena]|uniref:hypothetical protein n=1 Tax=Pyricularia pennisetigena TaxID=1578925 RepID=UPI001152F529|nr:hypothetical protein PpBr36_08855 [Pyricularia pennisetigena]TLS24044.1 hypothetical protein PpBr36_08855 [Pyricularia pennisetigena]